MSGLTHLLSSESNAVLFNANNMQVMSRLVIDTHRYNAVYADCIYESHDFSWVDLCYELLTEDGVLFVQTDQHTAAEYKLYLDKIFGKKGYVNWLIYIQDWGGVSNRRFSRKHDDIFFYAKSSNYKFYPERVKIRKATAGTALDKRGDGLKIPIDVFYDLGNFSTLDKERVKWYNTNIQWQKPLKLMDRLLLPTTDENDWVLDPFMGSGTTALWSLQNKRNFVGIENNTDIYKVALDRLIKNGYRPESPFADEEGLLPTC